MEEYYDVMYMESYGWWLLAMAFNASPEQQQELEEYAFDGIEDLGIRISSRGDRVIVSIHCQLREDFIPDEDWDADDEDYEDEEDDEGEKEQDKEGGDAVGKRDVDRVVVVETDNYLLNLLARIRCQIMARDYRALYAVWEKYHYRGEDEEGAEEVASGEMEREGPPVPAEKKTGREVIAALRDLLVVP